MAEKSDQMEKAGKIKKEKARLSKIFKPMDKNRRSLVDGLINQASFMRVLLDELEQEINEKGCSMMGAQGRKKTPEAEMYVAMTKNYQAVIKQLVDLLDKNVRPAASEELKALNAFTK